MARKLNASVGRMGGVNYRDDVITVQQLLNQVPITSGGPSPPLKVDGICGSKTINAIQVFQVKQLGWSMADGRVDPNGATHTRLNTFDKSSGDSPEYPGLRYISFYIRRLGTKTSFKPVATELFFEVCNVRAAKERAYYWLQLPGRIMPSWRAHGDWSYRRFFTNTPRAIHDLTCPAAYHSSRISGKVSSHMDLYLHGPVQIENLPHHLIGPNGMIGPGNNDVNTAINGLFQFQAMS